MLASISASVSSSGSGSESLSNPAGRGHTNHYLHTEKSKVQLFGFQNFMKSENLILAHYRAPFKTCGVLK